MLASATHAQDAAATEVASLFEQGRYDRALAESEFIEDSALRAAWRFHVLFHAGDLREALRAALAGLRDAPHSLELHQNAVSCALTLGLGGLASELSDSWRREIDASALDAAGRSNWLEAQRRLAEQAAEVRRLERSADDAARRSRAVSLAAGFAAVIALAWAARRAAGDVPLQPE